ncbi:EGF-like domain protein [Cooperia oncophora]
MLMSLRPLNHTIRSVYDVPVIAQPENGRPSTQRVVMLADCHITVKQPIDPTGIKATINGADSDIELKTLQISDGLEQSSVQVVLYAAPAGVADFLDELQRSYSDLTFYPLAVDIDAAEHRNTLSLAVVDRNRRVIAADDSRDILRSFFQKDDFPHTLLQSMKTSLCDDYVCSNGGKCRQMIALHNGSTSFYGSESIWSIPNGVLTTRCKCAFGYGGEFCDEVNRMRWSHFGVCLAGICECLAGFAGVDCSMRVFGSNERKQKKRPAELKKASKKRKTSCSEMNCGDGVCHTEGGRAICHCVGGFQAVDCSTAEQAISTTSGSITLMPTEQLRKILSNGTSSPAAMEFCNNSRSIEIDFRTRKAHGTIVALSYEGQFAVIDVHASVVRYRVFDSYRTPVEITLGSQPVGDGRWHRVVLELSEDRKTVNVTCN